MGQRGRDVTKAARISPRIGWIATAVLAVVLIAAWIDGGEEPLREISQPADLTEVAR